MKNEIDKTPRRLKRGKIDGVLLSQTVINIEIQRSHMYVRTTVLEGEIS